MEVIKLWEKTPYFEPSYAQEEPCLLPFIVDGAKSVVIVCPGGAYQWRAEDHEGIAIAKKLNENGISAFVLRYRIAPYHHPVPWMDAMRAIRTVRSLAGKYGYAENHIAIMGFSAGGHLAASAVTHFDSGLESGDEIDACSSRPDLGILCYAVIDLEGEFAERGSARNLVGPMTDENGENPPAVWQALAKELSAQNAINSYSKENTPPCFIWHTAGDNCVPVENAYMMGAALSKWKVPCEMHVYPYGDHGLGLAEETMPYISNWMDHLVKFINLHFGK